MRWWPGSGSPCSRCACSDAGRRRGGARSQVDAEQLRGRPLWLDGYNVLTTIEAALAGGVILAARDGAYRDMASMHGSYRKVAETLPGLGTDRPHAGRLGVARVSLVARPAGLQQRPA